MTSLLKIFYDQSRYSIATHDVLHMVMVVDADVERVSHLRVLRNQIVYLSQNLKHGKNKIKQFHTSSLAFGPIR